jgi:phosphoenolpyruvate synthase/pyruvate phosphate dikinase
MEYVMNYTCLEFQDKSKTKLATVAGKGANLGELIRIEGIHVPDGFCISMKALKGVTDETPAMLPALIKDGQRIRVYSTIENRSLSQLINFKISQKNQIPYNKTKLIKLEYKTNIISL